MEAPFMIIKSFLKSVEYGSPNTPGLFFSNNAAAATLGVSIDVQAKVAEGTSLFLVDLITRVTPKVEEQVVFDIKLIYSALVELDTTLDEETRKRILQVLVPQNLFNPLRALIWDITLSSGFPPLMLNDDFISNTVGNTAENSVNDIENSTDTDELENICITDDSKVNNLPLGYDWIIKDLQSTKAGAEFLQTLIQEGQVDISCYEELPLYEYYYRFLRPIKYHHPDVECDDSFWDILFQIIFAEGEDAKVIDGKTEVPEIELNIGGERKCISDLSIEELKSLTSDLAVQAFSHSLVDIIGANIDIDYSARINENNPALKEELLALYNCNHPYANTDTVAFVDRIYERIKECDLQTFPHRL